MLAKLVDMLYERNDIAFQRGRFRVRGDVVEVHPANLDEEAIRIEFFGDEIDSHHALRSAHRPHARATDDVHALPGEAIRHARTTSCNRALAHHPRGTG